VKCTTHWPSATGSNRDGGSQLHLLHLDGGQIVQLTDYKGIRAQQSCVHPSKEIAYYIAGRELRSVRLDTFEEETLYRCPDGYKLHTPTITRDGRHVALCYCEDVPVSTETGVIYSTMAERYFRHPAGVVMRIETETGVARACWGEVAWISHVCIHPGDPDLILFCHEGGSNVHQRLWTVRVGRPTQAQKLHEQRNGERVVHEFFTRAGDVGFQCGQQSGGEYLVYDCYIRPDGTWLRQFRRPTSRFPGHIQCNSDGSLGVADGAHLEPDDGDGRNWIGLSRYVGGRAIVHRLCRHDTSGKTQNSHGHPIFSPDDRWVLYTSDKGGTCNVYMAEVPERL